MLRLELGPGWGLEGLGLELGPGPCGRARVGARSRVLEGGARTRA